jgi:hypothetical protein
MSTAIYSLAKDEVVVNHIVEYNSSQSYSVTIQDSPSNYPQLAIWLKAENLTSSYSQSQAIVYWTNSGLVNFTASATGSPILTMGSISSSVPGVGAPAVYFSGSATFNYGLNIVCGNSTINSAYTVMFLMRGCTGDYMFTDTNYLSTGVDRNRSGNLLLLRGYDPATSSPLSTDRTGSIVGTATYKFPTAQFYESDIDIGLNYATTLGGLLQGAINPVAYEVQGYVAELCVWTGSALTATQVTSLYRNYWKQKYFYEPLTSSTVVTQSLTLNATPPTKMSISTGSSGMTLKVWGQIVETASYTKQMTLGVNSNLTARFFEENTN